MGKKLFSTKSMFKMPKMMPSTKDLLGPEMKGLGIPSFKPKRRRKPSIAKMLRDV